MPVSFMVVVHDGSVGRALDWDHRVAGLRLIARRVTLLCP